MAKIGDLRVDMSLDSSGVQKGLKAAQDSISSVSAQMTRSVQSSTANSVKLITAPLSEVSGVMKDQLMVVQKQSQALVQNMNETFRRVKMPDNLTRGDAFKIGTDWQVASAEILKFIGELTRLGLITQQTSSRLKAFSFSMLETGYSVQQIKTGIMQTIKAVGEMGTGAQRSTSNVRAYALAMEQAAMSTQKLIEAGKGFVMLGSGGNGGSGGGGGGTTSSFNIDPEGDGRNSIILYRREMSALQVVGANTASSLRSSFKRTWKEFGTKGIKSLQRFVEQCDQIAHKGSMITKIWSAAKRIIQGIVISQTFYRGLNAIQDATRAVWEFSQQVENAQTAMAAMFGDTAKASRLTDVLQEFAAETAFSYEQANAGARKLLAYGIKSANLLTIMRPLADAAAASGDPRSFDAIAKAIGQIHTKGRLATQEVLQLTEAGIPAYEILQEELGLTSDELAEIGRQGISANLAINALINGMNKRYEGVGDVMQSTMSGMMDKLKDNLLIIGRSMFSPLYDGLKATLTKMTATVENWRAIVSKEGFAGLIKSLVSPEVFEQIKVFAAHLKILKYNMILWWQSIAPIVAELGKFALTIGNMVLPVINAFLYALNSITYYITNCTPAVRYLIAILGGFFIAQKAALLLLNLGAAVKSLWICKAVAKAVMFLVGAIRTLSLAMIKSPWIAVLAIATGGLIALATTSDKVKSSLTSLGGKIAKVFSVDPSKSFAEKNDKNTASAEEFSQALDASGESMDDLREKAEKANKAAKNSLMSFDEVFNLSDDMDDASTELDDSFDMGDYEIPEWDLGTPDFGEIEDMGLPKMSQIAKNLVKEFGKSFQNAFAGISIGAIIGAAIGGILGGPGGAMLGAKIGAVAGGIVGMIWDNFTQKWKNVFTGAGVSGLIGGLVGLFTPLGPLLGAAIGSAIGGLLGWFVDDSKGILEGFMGWLKTTFVVDWDKCWGHLETTWDNLKVIAETVWDDIKFTLEGFIDWIAGVFTLDFDRAWEGMTNTFKGLLGIVGGLIEGVIEILEGLLGFLDEIFGPALGNVWYGFTDVLRAFLGAVQGIWDGIYDILVGAIDLIYGLCSGDWAMAWEGWKQVVQGFAGGIESILGGIEGILQGILTFIDGVFTAAWGTGWETCKDIFSGFGQGIGEIWNGFMDTCSGVLEFISGVFTADWGGAWEGIKNTFDGIFRVCEGILDTFQGACSGLCSWLDTTLTKHWGGVWTTIKDLFRAPYELIVGLWNSLRGIFTGLITFISGTLAGNWSKAWKGLVNIFESIMSGLGTIIKAPLNLIIDAINWVIGGLNKISFTTPDWVPGVGGKEFGVNISKIPRLAKGGLITKNTFAELGEGNKHEAVIPLENGTAIDQISARIAQGLGPALAREMGAVLAQSTTGTSNDLQPLYVGTLIADDRSLRELERKMQVIRVGESRGRRG